MEAEQKAQLTAQSADQQLSQMHSVMFAEVDKIRRDAEAFQNSASEQVRTVAATAGRRLSDASVSNLLFQGQVEQLVKEKAEADKRSEQRSMRSSAASAHSTYDISGSPRTPPKKEYEKLGPSYF